MTTKTRRIPIDELNLRRDGFYYLDSYGVRFHLPAFMIAELQREGLGGVERALYQEPCDEQFSQLSKAQRTVVRAFLEHLLDDPEFSFEWAHIQKALDGYWASTAPEKPIIPRQPSTITEDSRSCE